MSRQWKFLKDREWFTPTQRNHKMACCDCGLVHTMDFRVNRKGKVELRASRDEKLTVSRRRSIDKSLERAERQKQLSKRRPR